jgi:hypothetical protein
MRGSRIKYPSVEKLPDNACKISSYAKDRQISVAYVYKLYKQGKIEIIDFQGLNFVLT